MKSFLAFSVIVGSITGFIIFAANIDDKVGDTKKQVKEIADRFPDRLRGDEENVKDPWGRLITIEHSDGVFEGVEVKSAGPDREFGTEDDIVSYNVTAVRVDKAGEKFGKTVGDFGIGSFKGLYRSVKEHLSGAPHEK